LSRHPVRAAALLYALLSLALLAPGLLPGRTISTADSLYFSPPWAASRPANLQRLSNNELGDAVLQFQPFAAYAKRQLPEVPLWNPYLMSGRPLLADDQSAVFSPFTVPAYVMPLLTSLGWSAALKLFVAAFGAFLLARALGMRGGGAVLSGLVYGFNFWIVTWLAYPHSGVWAVFPWLLLATELVVRRPDPLSAGALAVAVAAQFLCGHAESSFDILVAVACFFVLRSVQVGRRSRERRRFARNVLASFLFGALAGTALAAFVLVPFVELLLGSADIHQRAGMAVDQHLAARGLLTLFLPDYWGRPTQTPLTPFIRAQAYYAGALPLLLAIVALWIRPTATRVAIAVFGFAGLAVAVGIPPFLQVITRLPIFSSGHNSRLIPWYMMAVALLAGWGLDDLRALPTRAGGWRRWLPALLAVALITPVAVVLARGEIRHLPGRAVLVATGLVSAPGPQASVAASLIHLAALIGWLVLACAAITLIALALAGRRRGRVLVALVLGLVILDLFHADTGYYGGVAQANARQPATGAIRYLEAHRATRFEAIGDIPWNVIAMRYSLQEAGGYDLPIPSRFDRLWRREVDPEHPSQVGRTFADIPLILPRVDARRLHTLRLLGVGNLLLAPTGPPLHGPGLHQVYSGPDARVYAVAQPQPRAVVVSAQRVAGDAADALRAVSNQGFDARRSVVTEQVMPRLARLGGSTHGAPAPPGAATITSYQPERVQIRVTSTRPGALVLDDSYAPGWSATVDGRPARVYRVDYVLRGVPVGAGAHTVIFTYEPTSWRVGWIVSVLGAVIVFAALLGGWRRRRQLERRVSWTP
jgi:hypothetical protein